MNIHFFNSLVEAILVLVAMILVAALLKRRGILKSEHSGVFARVVTTYTLPALIFTALSSHKFEMRELLLPALLFGSELICGVVAWCVGSIMKLSKPAKGGLILASTFGSSAFLGYAVVKGVFGQSDGALAEAVMISELGVGIPIFTLGVLVAVAFGKSDASFEEKRSDMLSFFRSPVFIALIAGVLFPWLNVPAKNSVISGIFTFLHVVANANTLFVTLALGVMLEFKSFKKVLPVVLVASVIKLGLQPLLVALPSGVLHMPELWQEILLLEAAMPPAVLTAVYAKRYGCDSALTSILVFTTLLCSLLSIIGIFLFAGFA